MPGPTEHGDIVALVLGRKTQPHVRSQAKRIVHGAIILSSPTGQKSWADAVLPIGEFQPEVGAQPEAGLEEQSTAIAAYPTAEKVSIVRVGIVVDIVPVEEMSSLVIIADARGSQFGSPGPIFLDRAAATGRCPG